jgi:hypothetical protein
MHPRAHCRCSGQSLGTFVGVDDALILILQKKKEVTQRLKDAGVDLSELWIEKMEEEEPELVFNPPPYLTTA